MDDHNYSKQFHQNVCGICNKSFSRIDSLNRHLSRIHKVDKKSIIKTRKSYKCFYCQSLSFNAHYSYITHLSSEHNINCLVLNMQFGSLSEFMIWKNKEQCIQKCFFSIIGKKMEKNTNYTIYYSTCSRNTAKCKMTNRVRRANLKRLVKMVGTCPARLVWKVLNDDGEVEVEYFKHHYGHDITNMLRYNSENDDGSNDLVEDVSNNLVEYGPNDFAKDVSNYLVEDDSNDLVEDDPNDMIEDVSNDCAEDVSNDLVEDVSNDLVEDVSNDLVEDVSNDLVEDVSNDYAEDVSNELVEDVSNDMVEDVSNELVEDVSNDYAEDVLNDMVEDVSNELVEDVSNDYAEDVLNDMVEDVSNELVEDVSNDLMDVVSNDFAEDSPNEKNECLYLNEKLCRLLNQTNDKDKLKQVSKLLNLAIDLLSVDDCDTN